MDAQKFYDRITELKEQSKAIYEEIHNLEEEFVKEFQDYEVPIVDKEGKPKFIRIYEPEGKFVYNTKYEVGLRVKAQKPYKP